MNTYEVTIKAKGVTCDEDIEVTITFYPIFAISTTSALNKSKTIFTSKFKGYEISQTNVKLISLG